MGKNKVINIENGMPTVDEARQRLATELQKAKREGISSLKIIHGYGSTGVGGKLRVALRKSLTLRVREGLIKAFVPGEDWSVFDESTRLILNLCPELERDRDLQNGNPGITIILL